VQELSGLEFDLGDRLFFRENEEDEVELAFVPLQIVALKKVAWYEAGEVQMGSLGMFLIIFLSPFVVWPLGALISRLRKQTSTATTRSKRARWAAGIVSALNFIFLITLLLTVKDLSLGVPPIVQIALIIPIVTGLLTLILVVMMILLWLKGSWSILGRFYYSFLTLTAVLFLAWAYYWNLIGWRY
jgi:hypothetical protein